MLVRAVVGHDVDDQSQPVRVKRLAQSEDLDGALLFLASPASAYVTGTVISVDGGHGVAAI